jgi:AraC-like DNA-binding protein
VEPRQACRAAGIGVVAVSDHDGRPRSHRAVPALSARLVVSLGAPIETLRSRQPVVYAELSPSTAQRLTGVPLSEVDAGGVSADAVLPWADALCEELAECAADRREAVVRARLLDHLARADDHRTRSEDALRTLGAIEACGGTASVEQLARTAHLSTRRLRDLMQSSLGVTPKFASRVARLSSALRRAGGGAHSWAQVAADCGYHDQSHLVRDFRDLMDTTPSAWLGEEGRNLQGRRRPAR